MNKKIKLVVEFIKKLDRYHLKMGLRSYAERGSPINQFQLAEVCLDESLVVEAYAWASTAFYQGMREAKYIIDAAWDLTSREDKEKAQNLARDYRLYYTRR